MVTRWLSAGARNKPTKLVQAAWRGAHALAHFSSGKMPSGRPVASSHSTRRIKTSKKNLNIKLESSDEPWSWLAKTKGLLGDLLPVPVPLHLIKPPLPPLLL